MTIYSVGYGNRTFEAFIKLVQAQRVTHLVDVRSVPYSSYQVSFRRESLAQWLPEHGLKYVSMGDTLGGAIVRSAGADSNATLKLGIERLIAAASDADRRLCLMCGCMLPDSCHRGLGLGAPLIAAGVEYIHIGKQGELIPHGELVARIGQESLF